MKSLLLALVLLTPPTTLAHTHGMFPIVQGPTDGTSTSLVVTHKKNRFYWYVLVDKITQETLHPQNKKIFKHWYSKHQNVRLEFTGLKKHHPYFFRVLTRSGQTLDERDLQTLDLSKKHLRMALVSCSDYRDLKNRKPAWETLYAKDPQVIFMIGDNVYSEWALFPATPSMVWWYYTLTRYRLPIYRERKLIPTFATWDDHDFGWNNGDRRYKYKWKTKATFEAFWPQSLETVSFKRGPGVSSVFTGFGQKFFFMDNRFFRSGKKATTRITHWGPEQERWFTKELHNRPQPTWIFDGTQFFGAYHDGESYERNHPKRFRWLLDKLTQFSQPVVFGSGDRHYSEIMAVNELGYPTYELTSSGIHHFEIIPEKGESKGKEFNPRRMEFTNQDNFLFIETETRPGTIEMKVTSTGAHGETYFQRDLTVSKP